jgi:uncharacterized protein (TIGR03083 family)
MPLDHAGVIEAEAARLLAAYEHDRAGRVPWSDRWTVGTVARHVAGTHHVVAQVLEGRPTADFGLFATLASPAKDDPGFPVWFAEGTAALCARLRAIAPDEECWSWYAVGRSVGFWGRRMAQETLVHRWDAEAGAGLAGAPMEPPVAADGVDELLDVFVRTTRELQGAPAGPLVHLEGTDAGRQWFLDLREPGGRALASGPVECATSLRGSAEGLLLVLWGRLDPESAGVEVQGDRDLMERWGELIPPM